jgi:hypothetical protein
MSTKTSSGVPRVIILATIVVVLATSVGVVLHVGVGRCDGHHGITFGYPIIFWTAAHELDQDQPAQCRPRFHKAFKD